MTTKPSTEVVMEAIEDLHAQEQVVTRETLAEVTGLKLTVIDDRLSYLVDSGQIHRVQRGVFVPAPQHKPARLISKTMLPDGSVSIEIGDDYVVLLTPRENRRLAELMAGAGMQFATIELGHQTANVLAEQQLQIKQLKRDVHSLRKALRAKNSPQIGLLESEQEGGAMADA